MSDSEREDQQEEFSFLGFGGLFNSLAQEHENNILQAIRRYSTLQDIEEPDQQDNRGIVSSTPIVTPNDTPTGTPQVTPINTPPSSPRRSVRTEKFQSTYSVNLRESLPSLVSDISLLVNSIPVRSSSSLPSIHLNSQSTQKKVTMSYQAFDRSLRMHNKLEKEVQKSIVDLESAIQNDRGKYEVKKLIDIIEVDREALREAGDKVSEYELVNPTFKEEEWQTSWSKVDRRARAIVKTGKEYCLDKAVNAVPAASPGVKYEKLQVEPFEGDPMAWSFWQENAKKVISGLGVTEQRFWLKQKILGDAKDFIGQYDLENLDIESIFKRLDSRFGQPHMKVKKVALANKKMVILDESSSMADIDKFWNKYMNIAGECAGLELSAQSLTIILAMLHLPPRFRERLESKMREAKDDYKFTRADTMTPFSLVREEMLSLYPEQVQKHNFAVSSVSASNPTVTVDGGPGYNSANRNQNLNRQSWVGNRGRVQPRQLKCTYCSDSHEARSCQLYDTPEKRRERLVALDRCRACMMTLSFHQDDCNPNAYCSYHPTERHFWHLCDGPNFTHPGKQTAASSRA